MPRKILKGVNMEIFKAASTPNQIAAQQSTQNTQNRAVEHTQIQSDSTQKPNKDELHEELSLSNEELAKKTKEATQRLNQQMEKLDTNLRFNYDDKINFMVVQVTEASTGKLIRQLPSEQAIKISEYFRESIGILFDKES